MHRARVATKTKITVKFRPLTGSELTMIQNLTTNQTFSVKYYNPAGNQVNKTMYKGTDVYAIWTLYDSASGLYKNYEIHLVEV